MTQLSIKIGEKIRRLRTALRYSQEQLAGFAGMSPKYLSEVERGERNISVQLLAALAKELDVPPSEMLADDQAPDREELLAQIMRLLQSMPVELLAFVHRTLMLGNADLKTSASGERAQSTQGGAAVKFKYEFIKKSPPQPYGDSVVQLQAESVSKKRPPTHSRRQPGRIYN